MKFRNKIYPAFLFPSSIPRYFRVRPNMRKFDELLTSNRKKKDICSLAIYTYKAFKKEMS